MDSFAALEERYRRAPVKIADPSSGDAAGFLVLDRGRTRAILSSTNELGVSYGKQGWFDLRLRNSGDEPLILHNALFLNATRFGKGPFENHLFPNVVIFNADRITKDLKVRSVAVQLRSLGSFFHYQIVEHISTYALRKKGKAKLLAQLRLRKSERNIRFNPRDIFLVHRPPTAVKFQVDRRKYSVFMGWTSSHGWGSKLDVSVEPIAAIDFGESIDLDEAIDRVWEWKRFFSQVAMHSLDLQTFAARSQRQPRHSFASLYFPNEPTTTAQVHPGDIPLNLWKDRKQFSQIMQQWLSKESERRVFRVAVDHVLEASTGRVAPEDLVTLCGAIESLPELQSPSALKQADVDAMASGAVAAARELKIKIDEQRISGLLGMLKKDSLSGRLNRLMESFSTEIHQNFSKLLVASINDLRNAAAHGALLSEMKRPKVAPTIRGLLAACITYDLATSGMPKSWKRSSLLPLVEVNRAVMELEKLSESDRKRR